MPHVFMNARDPVSCYTHFLGACLSMVAALLLFGKSRMTAAPLPVTVGGVVFGLSLLALYTASAVYHFYRGSDRVLLRLRKLDHSIIYVLIAGTYTPLVLRFFAPARAVLFLAAIWGIALGGIVMKLFWLNAPRWLYTSLYLLMGWAVVFEIPAFSAMPAACLALIAGGGVSYSVGAVIYLLKKPNLSPLLGFHELFHLLILLGSALHFIAIFGFVI
ncbi:MAG: hemolysin III family protein [Oscillospiraceae bacterium]